MDPLSENTVSAVLNYNYDRNGDYFYTDLDINTEFKPYGYGISNFRMNIYTRWGERVFETDDIEIGWDGTHYLNGADCFIGIYVYYIEVENIYGEIFKYENQVRLIR